MQSGAIGIVNISANGNGGLFSTSGTIGAKMLQVAAPSYFDGGYKGALIVQSAGNYAACAFDWAFNGQSSFDGILVVGGLDENAQPVKALNGIAGYAGDDAASNTGTCVDFWAPSQRVKSTWSGNGYTFLAGTSMAAPHIAGLAAAILAADPYIDTSSALESAVRSRIVSVTGSNLPMARWAGGAPLAKPTVEIAEGATNRISISQSGFSLFPDQLNLRFDSAGATSCYVDVVRNGYFQGRFYFGSSANIGSYGGTHYGGNFTWTVTCTSAQNQQTTVSASGHIRRRVNLD